MSTPKTRLPVLASVVPPGGVVYASAPLSNWLLNDAAFNIQRFIADEVQRAFEVDARPLKNRRPRAKQSAKSRGLKVKP